MINTRLALLLALLCLLVLAGLLLFLPVQNISSPTELAKLKENQKVSVSGIVVKEQSHSEIRTLTLNNKLSLSCACPSVPALKDKNIKAEAKFSSFGKKINLEVTKLEILP